MFDFESRNIKRVYRLSPVLEGMAIVRRLGYLIDPLVERRLDELMDALLTAQQYISAERARKE
jgi:hypothetical protein